MALSVSLVIINYNGLRWLDDCLESVFAQTRAADEVLVVDNGSTDGSAGHLRRQWPKVGVVELEENLGFAAACNRGIERSGGSLVGVLNNDILLARDWLEKLLANASREWDLWASRIVFASDPETVDSAGDGMSVVGAAFKHGHGGPVSRHLAHREVFSPCAAAALYRRSMLEAVGGFDDDFFLVYEDADLGMRARLAGHRCLYVPEAVVHHRVNASIGTLSPAYVFYGQRNSSYVFWQNFPGPLLLLYLPERILFELAAFAYFTLKGRGGSYLRAKWAFLTDLPRVLRKRRRIQAGARTSWRELRRLLTRNWLKGRLKPARTL